MRKACLSSVDPVDITIACGVAMLALLALATPDRLVETMPPCLISLLTGRHCWGCGITHAVLALLHGNFSLAWEYNPRGFLVAPLLGWAYLCLLARIFRTQLPRSGFQGSGRAANKTSVD